MNELFFYLVTRLPGNAFLTNEIYCNQDEETQAEEEQSELEFVKKWEQDHEAASKNSKKQQGMHEKIKDRKSLEIDWIQSQAVASPFAYCLTRMKIKFKELIASQKFY